MDVFSTVVQIARKEASTPTPHCVRIVQTLDGRREEVPIKFGKLYADTVRIEEEIKNAGYDLVVMWECQCERIYKMENLATARPNLEYLCPLVPRDVYFGGHTSCV